MKLVKIKENFSLGIVASSEITGVKMFTAGHFRFWLFLVNIDISINHALAFHVRLIENSAF
ncbi:MAG: hypothetical protein HOF29_13300 [Candidatus Marinimicrobia bacterium]|jgi:hypothetical protein|nr:hypothetical protein [Candidatus Neomarinimicrobiota bacterium]MBT3760954.1 hypothetical protein [Candidatus Neomarinimicrobiota bacterium]MBT3897023.1 hypothetical protein [Candidatus Neomarinimicrobiota bacterium]MBT4174039.1 hypothetical protein [Candidatus Neomarinimicrobiota bacterium]MBT4538650.1 hypothetical protein [Candidatus Neomarinimicrobiota bacterium]